MQRNMTMTREQFIQHEMRVWDAEYVENLLNSGYDAILTTAGWKWILPSDSIIVEQVEAEASSINQSTGVG